MQTKSFRDAMSLVKVFSVTRTASLRQAQCVLTCVPQRAKGDYVLVNPPRVGTPSWGELTDKAAHSLFLTGHHPVSFVSQCSLIETNSDRVVPRPGRHTGTHLQRASHHQLSVREGSPLSQVLSATQPCLCLLVVQ